MSVRVALCQLDPAVGGLEANVELIAETAAEAAAQGASLALFSELALTAYGPRDLLDREAFMDDVERAVAQLATRLPKGLVCLVGAPVRSGRELGRALVNAILVFEQGALKRTIHKHLLPTYDVFDEDRYFEASTQEAAASLIEVGGLRFGVTICEDAWNDVEVMRGRRYARNPIQDVVDAGADVIVNLAGSPFTRTKREGRARMLRAIAKKHERPLLMVNQVGAHDDLIFDGASLAIDASGEITAHAHSFEEDLVLVEVDDKSATGAMRAQPQSDAAAVLDALTLGVRDYARRCGIQKVFVGLSGGIDSALVAAIAVRALGSARVHGVGMPSRYSSEGSVTDAKALADALGVDFRLVPLEPLFKPYLEVLPEHLDAISPEAPGDVTFENVQARLRMSILMALANRAGAMLLTTGNKSEIACGYCTLYGDMAGGLAVIGDLYKTFVYEVSRELNRQAGKSLIPESTLTKPPSAELRPGQTDQDSLPPYEVLDAILTRFIEEQKSSAAIVAEGFDGEVVAQVERLMRISEHKRRQMPPGLIVTSKAFGPGRRMPIAQRYRL